MLSQNLAEADARLAILHGKRTIALTKGYVTLVDEADFPWVSEFKWQAHVRKKTPEPKIYATRGSRCDGRKKNINLHRLIINAPEGVDVDHRNNDGLDNTRDNLRLAVGNRNRWNRQPNNGKEFKGVRSEGKHIGRWRASIRVDGKRLHLGIYARPEDAARAYDVAALKYHGEFARLNFPAEACASA